MLRDFCTINSIILERNVSLIPLWHVLRYIFFSKKLRYILSFSHKGNENSVSLHQLLSKVIIKALYKLNLFNLVCFLNLPVHHIKIIPGEINGVHQVSLGFILGNSIIYHLNNSNSSCAQMSHTRIPAS